MISEAEKLFTSHCEFIAGVDTLDRMIGDSLPEVAFAGRSNVGKSSLINALTGRKALARTSNTPGRTQQLNFFHIGGAHDLAFHLVDMPGYGYAKVSKSKIKNWIKVLQTYLKGRVSLRLCLILVDSRHGLKDADKDMMDMLNKAAVPYRIILTKIDKANAKELDKVHADIKDALVKNPAAFPEPLMTSSEKKKGIDDVRQAIMAAIAS